MNLLPLEKIQHRIYMIRGHKVMLDYDLAELYEVTTGNLNLAVRRNSSRFPNDFMFRLTPVEVRALVLQFARPKGRGGRQIPPYAFTEHGVSMLSSILKSERAILVNIAIMRAFGRLRELLSSHKHLAKKLDALEKKYDEQFKVVFDAIRKLMQPSKEITPIPRVKGFQQE